MGSLVRPVRAGIAWLSLCAAFSTPIFASGTDYEGKWNAVSPKGGITILEITGSTDGSGAMYVHAFGKCSPSPCDLGSATLTGLDSVASRPGMPEPALVGNATITTSSEIVTLKISGLKSAGMNEFITVQSTIVPKDRFKREPPIAATDTFQKAVLRMMRPLPTPAATPSASPTASP